MQGKNNFPSLVDLGNPKDQISPLINGIGILSSDRYQDKERAEGKDQLEEASLGDRENRGIRGGSCSEAGAQLGAC